MSASLCWMIATATATDDDDDHDHDHDAAAAAAISPWLNSNDFIQMKIDENRY